jgi:predicted transcriptional regulator
MLKETDVGIIKWLLADADYPQAELARKFSVSTSVIRDIKKGKTWTHVVSAYAQFTRIDHARQAA